MSQISKTDLELALNEHKKGQLKKAETLYRKLIKIEPQNSNVWYLLGVLCQTGGNTKNAKEYLDRSIELTPQFPEALNARGILYKEEGEITKAKDDFKAALSILPNFPEGLTNLADTYRVNGNLAEAKQLNNKAIKLAPDLAPAFNNQGIIEKELGHLNKAKKAFRKALKLDRNLIDASINLATVLGHLNQTKLALKTAEQIVNKTPTYAPAHNCLGTLFFNIGKFTNARNSFKIACKINPKYADAHNNLANSLTRLNKIREAHNYYNVALKIEPNNPDFWANKAAAFQAENEISAALSACRKALNINPNHADAKWNHSIARLLSGDLLEGFADYEARWLLPEFKQRFPDESLWANQDLTGKSILLRSEQGYGDTIQFIRYVTFIANKKPRNIYLETHKPLIELLSQIPKINKIYNRGERLPEWDYHIPLMSLPHRFKTTLRTIPISIPYLKAKVRSPFNFANTQTKEKNLKIGLVWAGRRTHNNDQNRSMSLDLCLHFVKNNNAQFYSLQLGGSTECKKHPTLITDLSPHLIDFATTASILQHLDLIITVDTAVAHLAGAMGIRCWVMLPFAPDWRWLLGEDYSPWYPSIKLFRQSKLGCWRGVVKLINSTLKDFDVQEGLKLSR